MQTLEENTLNILLKVNIIYPIDIDSETININEYLWKGTFFFIIIIFFTFFFFHFLHKNMHVCTHYSFQHE